MFECLNLKFILYFLQKGFGLTFSRLLLAERLCQNKLLGSSFRIVIRNDFDVQTSKYYVYIYIDSNAFHAFDWNFFKTCHLGTFLFKKPDLIIQNSPGLESNFPIIIVSWHIRFRAAFCLSTDPKSPVEISSSDYSLRSSMLFSRVVISCCTRLAPFRSFPFHSRNDFLRVDIALE